ncbi:MAG: SURF1 family protein [Proteobacteria bacterium]|nr:SURF1 family protein [Pseudomonadota bacterium]
MGSRQILRPLPLLGMIAILILLVALGVWQLRRAAQKQEMFDEFAARAQGPTIQVLTEPLGLEQAWSRAQVTGQYSDHGQFLVDNRLHQGQPGFYVVTPFRIDASEVRILVNRGWIPLLDTRAKLPEPQVPLGLREIRGQLVTPMSAFTLERQLPVFGAPLRQNLNLAFLTAAAPFPLHDYVLRLDPDMPDGFVRQWPVPDQQSIRRHQAYAAQWFGLALVFVGVVTALVRRERRSIG